jgi:hypothetical protein
MTSFITGRIYGFDANGSRWAMAMTFETEETSWIAREERAVGIATLAAPQDLGISWVNYNEEFGGEFGGNHPMARELGEFGPERPFLVPMRGTDLYECPIPEGVTCF